MGPFLPGRLSCLLARDMTVAFIGPLFPRKAESQSLVITIPFDRPQPPTRLALLTSAAQRTLGISNQNTEDPLSICLPSQPPQWGLRYLR